MSRLTFWVYIIIHNGRSLFRRPLILHSSHTSCKAVQVEHSDHKPCHVFWMNTSAWHIRSPFSASSRTSEPVANRCRSLRMYAIKAQKWAESVAQSRNQNVNTISASRGSGDFKLHPSRTMMPPSLPPPT